MDFRQALKVLQDSPAGTLVAMPEHHLQFNPPAADGRPAVHRDGLGIICHPNTSVFVSDEVKWFFAAYYPAIQMEFLLPNSVELIPEWKVVTFDEYQEERKLRLSDGVSSEAA